MRILLFILIVLASFSSISAKPLLPKEKDYVITADEIPPSVNIAYFGSPYCASSPSVIPDMIGSGDYMGGIFTASPTGLAINSATGEINPAESAIGNYIITYTTPSGPEGSAMASYTISIGSITPTFSAIAPVCQGSSVAPLPTTSNNGITGTWSPAVIDNMNTTIYTFVPDATQCAVMVTMTLIVNPLPEPVITSITGNTIACVDWDGTEVMNGLVLSSGITNPDYTFEWYIDNNYISGQNGSDLVITNVSAAHNIYTVIAVSNSSGCSSLIDTNSTFDVVRSGSASDVSFIVTNLSGVQNITVNCAGYGSYQYSLDGGPFQNIPVFEDVALGYHLVTIADTNGCGDNNVTILIVESAVPAPDGPNVQDFADGDTLADVVVSGDNVQWYATAVSSNSAKLTSPDALPLTTLLVDGTTYYATQTINDVESVARLAVTVNVTLGVDAHDILTLAYSPNPVKNSLNLKTGKTMSSVTILNVLGQVLKTTSYNLSEVTEDMSNYTTGTYFVKVVSGDEMKVVKIIKE
ncbi:T9SS type A sorting domain-containing protein [Flavobacterium phycosphaerae]|uniref:T9SS type A sorting domain-containing protein n=1 Tax=Flavobacterium phycosphaerae TaxID=2697515 RepID=UPI00138A148A|nr:T9SS type A sorting domain-containing protein [Flavobacterium phycosphaerae]